MQKQLILVAVRGQHTQVVFGPALPGVVGAKKAQLLKSGNWPKPWRFQLRTQEGYNKIKILTKKLKT